MPATLDALSLICEVLTWVGFATGVPLTLVGLIIGRRARRWEETSGVIIDYGAEGHGLRWMGPGGSLHERAVSVSFTETAVQDAVTLYIDRFDPERCRMDSPEHDGRAARMTGWVMIGLGAGAAVVSIALLFL